MAERNRSFHCISASSINELEEQRSLKQGIVTILAMDPENTRASSSSLRRTLSADMSSKKWLPQNGFLSSVRNIASYNESSSSSSFSSDDEESERRTEKPEMGEIWGSFLAPKSDVSMDRLPVYVHPLEKKSASIMSNLSLQMCTELIGSENGSDGFYSDIAGNFSDQVEETKEFDSIRAKNSSALLFPPPLSSINGGDGTAVHLKSHRTDGRLILDVIPVPQINCFRANRENGRFRLTLNLEERYNNGFDTAETVVDEMIPASNVRKGMMTKEEDLLVSQSLSPPPSPLFTRMNPFPVTPTATKFNAYEYFRWSKTAVPGYLNRRNPPLMDRNNCKNDNESKTEYSVPYLNSCREYRRSLLIWEPHCIATS